MSPEEEDCLVSSCISRGYRVYGANLGRTAEFTSKIVHAINMHAVNMRMDAAVATLEKSARNRDGAMVKVPPKHRAKANDDGAEGHGKHKKKRKRDQDNVQCKETAGNCDSSREGLLHFIVCVGKSADEISSGKDKREELYTLSQVGAHVCVCVCVCVHMCVILYSPAW